MQRSNWLLAAGLSGVLALSGTARAAKVEVKGAHLCCGACNKLVTDILSGINGVQGSVNTKTKIISITGSSDFAVQQALDALAKSGFYGTTGDDKLKFKDDSGVKEGKVKSLTVQGAHNCCGACCKALKATVKKVKGVESDDAKPKANSFTVTGDFDAAELVKALNEAGFHVKVK